jgi:hypothetical protein
MKSLELHDLAFIPTPNGGLDIRRVRTEDPPSTRRDNRIATLNSDDVPKLREFLNENPAR